ncbi:MAG TPA: hypothetical protein VN577_11610 [Terriglobales bacterium]|nr:hypothetical protein [Terriglobales bacterium]
MESAKEFVRDEELVERIKSVLARKGLTLHLVSKQSAVLFGRSSPYYLPHNMYYELRQGRFGPSLFQLFALSQISRYRLSGWLRLFGCDVAAIPHLQIQLSTQHTILLDSAVDDPNVYIPWFRNLPPHAQIGSVVPLSQVLGWGKARPLGSLTKPTGRHFLYARIGELDAIVFPDLFAGSIVRVDPEVANADIPSGLNEVSKRLFLVEHEHGLLCCRIRRTGQNRFVVGTQWSRPNVEYSISEDVTPIGLVDLEIRSLLAPKEPKIAVEPTRTLEGDPDLIMQTPLNALLRRARRKMGLSFRAASARSRELADLLGDEHYFVSPGTLSDYELKDALPRYFQKFISFCVVYAIPFHEIIEALDLHAQESGYESIPESTVADGLRSNLRENAALFDPDESGFLEQLVADLEEVPFFLRGSLRYLSGLPNLSLRDFFWIGEPRRGLHPSLQGGMLVVVNRLRKRPNTSRSIPLWQQPLFVILKRDGEYLCAHCSTEKQDLILHSYAGGQHSVERFRSGNVEVIGRIVMVIRRLP